MPWTVYTSLAAEAEACRVIIVIIVSLDIFACPT